MALRSNEDSNVLQQPKDTFTVLSINEYTPTESTLLGHYTTKYSHKYGALIAKKGLLNYTNIFSNKFIQNHVVKNEYNPMKVSGAKQDFRPRNPNSTTGESLNRCLADS